MTLVYISTVKVAEEEKGMVTVIAVVCAFVFVVIAMVIIAVYFCKLKLTYESSITYT